jgi:hypothetical protein
MILLQDHRRLTPESRSRAPDGTLTFQVDVARKRELERKAREAKERLAARRKAAEDARRRRAAARKRIQTEAGGTWDAKLVARVREAIGAKNTFTFDCEMLRGKATVSGVDRRGHLLISDPAGKISLPVAPGRLPMADRRGLAVALVRPGKADDCCLAAFYCLAFGDLETGRKMLARGGKAAEPVRAFFKKLGILE